MGQAWQWATGRASALGAANFTGRNFPVGTPTGVRVDLTNLAHVLPRCHRLGVAVSTGDPLERTAQPWSPNVTVHAGGADEATHLVLPIAGQGFGGGPPVLDYPPRPFIPEPGEAATPRG